MVRTRWEDIPSESRQRWQENTRQAKLRNKHETAWRREQRRRLGTGRRGCSVRCSADTLRKLKALNNAKRQLAMLEDSEVSFTGHKFSMAEQLMQVVDNAYRRTLGQLEAMAESEPRSLVILERTMEIAATG